MFNIVVEKYESLIFLFKWNNYNIDIRKIKIKL